MAPLALICFRSIYNVIKRLGEIYVIVAGYSEIYWSHFQPISKGVKSDTVHVGTLL